MAKPTPWRRDIRRRHWKATAPASAIAVDDDRGHLGRHGTAAPGAGALERARQVRGSASRGAEASTRFRVSNLAPDVVDRSQDPLARALQGIG
ncbi:50S ribosomal protein L32 [Pseudofulvimonas gallinarii]|uniref:50S ribosomal protein L32 n=1 Tax=Pseudofulvimonas gallinarii TaxID=634155 RepID=UPI0035EC85A5